MLLSIYNLNIMHGRNSTSAVIPPAVRKRTIQSNLGVIAQSIRSHTPDLITFQEVDAYSVLSGRFDQFSYLKELLQYPYSYFGASCTIPGVFVSGNCIFSKYPVQRCESYKFPITFPTDRMGFVAADVMTSAGSITLVSTHLVYLDWLHKDSRTRELKIMGDTLKERSRQCIIAGDFNCDVINKSEPLREFSEKHSFHATSTEPTYPSWEPDRRIDWILVRSGMRIAEYTILPDRVSDHRAVFARVELDRCSKQ